jgi:dihydrodipicolinate synthase/N-acetylneuraminate lyase
MSKKDLDLGGVIVATALPYKEDSSAPAGLAVDFDKYAEHCNWLIENGCHGVGPNGSLGEYSSLTDAERRQVVKTAVDTVAGRGLVVAGVHGAGWHQSKRWAELAAEDGADAVLCLPPTMYRASNEQVVDHFEHVSEAGLPMMVYNNPFDTKVDLVPELVAEIANIENVIAIKEFSGDVRRYFEIRELSDITVVAGADDVLFELMVDGAEGWFAGFPNTFPKESVEIYDLVRAGKVAEARALYIPLVAAFRWDSKTEFVQAIKMGMDMVGRYGGPSRPPRGPLTATHEKQLRGDMKRAMDFIAAR